MSKQKNGTLFSLALLSAATVSLSLILMNNTARNMNLIPHPDVKGIATGPASYPTGDCNGDNKVDAGDLSAISLEIYDGDGNAVADVGGGSFAGTPGCDADGNGIINDADTTCIQGIIYNNPNAYCQFPSSTPCMADINQDGIVDLSDFSALSKEFLKSAISNARADISGDGIVDITDFAFIQKNFFQTCN